VAFVGFQTPTDKTAYQNIIAPMMKEYGEKIQVVFKSYLPPAATQSVSAALGSACANEQGKYLQFVDAVFASQATWNKAKDANPLMKTYAAQAGLNAADFAKCLDSKKYQDLITESFKDGQSFGLQATPSIFVGSDLKAPTAKYDDVKKALDAQLAL
jgi:protein-disulfide isomerase